MADTFTLRIRDSFAGLQVDADGAAYTVTGADANLEAHGDFVMTASAGVYAVTGTDVVLAASSDAHPNEPAGMTAILANNGTVAQSGSDAFGASWMGAWATDGDPLTDRMNVVSDDTNPTGSGQAIRCTWLPAESTKCAISFGTFPAVYDELYICLRIKWEELWNRKIFYIDLANGNRFHVTRENDGRLRIQAGSTFESDDAPPVGIGQDMIVDTDRWYQIEWLFKATDDVGYCWVDGVLCITAQGPATSFASGFEGIEWYMDNNSIPAERHDRWGEIYVSGK